MKIRQIQASEILDSRGIPTIEAQVILEDQSIGISSSPSGDLLPGNSEASELRDNDPKRFEGMGVIKAVNNINNIIAPKLVGLDAEQQNNIDQTIISLDGTPNKARLGGNSTLAVSQAIVKAASMSYKMPVYAYLKHKYQTNVNTMPTPIFNVINGGKHGAGNLDFQEFHLIPSKRFAYHSALECGQEIYQSLKKVLTYRGAIHSVGEEGGFAPNLFTNMDALEVILEAIKSTHYQINKDVFLGLDAAANYFYKNNQYMIKDRAQGMSRNELIDYYTELNNDYHLFSLEDPLAYDDWAGWKQLNSTLGQSSLIIGDDLLTTNRNKVQKAIEQKACSAILIKINQRGTVSEAIDVITLAKQAGWAVIISHRLGETNDDFIADFSVGLGADYIKFGAPNRGERIAKYNRLLKIESELIKHA